MLLEYRYDELPLVEQAWRESDQQAISLATRRRLDQNGLRAAVLASQLPVGLERLLDTQLPVVADLLPDLVDAHRDPDLPRRSRLTGMLMQFQPGSMREIPVSGIHAVAHWTVHDGQRVTSGTAVQCRACVQLTPVRFTDAGVRLRLTPGFRTAETRPVFTASTRDFQLDDETPFLTLPGLQMEVDLRRNETLLVGPTGHSDPIGQLFFGNPDQEIWSDAYLRRLFLVRLLNLPAQ